MSGQVTDTRQSWGAAFKAYLQPVMLIMLALGFASGLPYMMVFQKMSFWLREVGIERSTIGFFYWVTFAYSFKFLWAPVVDNLKLPFLTKWLGHRRSWMLLAMVGTVIGMAVIGSSDPAANLTHTVIGALILSFAGATLDISIDAWRIESAPNVRVTRRRMQNAKDVITEYIVNPFLSIITRMGKWAFVVLLLVAFYRISDFTMGVMAYPLYSDLGFSKQSVGLISSGYGVWITIFGAMIGGLFVVRFGLMRSLLLGAVLTMITTAAYAWLSVQPDPLVRNLFVTIAADNIAGGFAATVFIAYLSSLVDKRYTATQYAFLSSLYSFFLKFASGFSGVFVDKIGYEKFFYLTAAYCIPVIALILFLMAFGSDASKGIQKQES